MATRHIHVERFSLTSRKQFREVLAALHAAVGHPEMEVFRKSVCAAKTLSEVENVVQAAVGPAGLMEFDRFDQGEVVHKGEQGEVPGMVRLVVGNPLILFNAKVGGTAWKSKLSWYIVANNDRTVHPDLQRFLAKRMDATTHAVDSSHVAMLSHPGLVIDVIRAAANAVQEQSMAA